MAPADEVVYRPEVLEEDFPAIRRNLQKRILRAVETRLQTQPAQYGTRLRRSLSSLWKLRVGDHRVVYELESNTVRVWAVAHRKRASLEVERRRGT